MNVWHDHLKIALVARAEFWIAHDHGETFHVIVVLRRHGVAVAKVDDVKVHSPTPVDQE